MTTTTKGSTPGGIIAGVIVGVLLACLIIASVLVLACKHYQITTYYIPLNFTVYYYRSRCPVAPYQGLYYNHKNYFILMFLTGDDANNTENNNNVDLLRVENIPNNPDPGPGMIM